MNCIIVAWVSWYLLPPSWIRDAIFYHSIVMKWTKHHILHVICHQVHHDYPSYFKRKTDYKSELGVTLTII